MEPASLHNLFREALSYHQAGRLEEADTLYKRILTAEPRHADSLHLRGVILHGAGQLDTARQLIRQAILIKSDAPAYYSNLANIEKDQGHLAEAVQHYERALQLQPDFAAAHYNLACLLQDQGNWTAAQAHYERALALQPALVPAHINLGNVMRELGQYGVAMQHYARALQIDPENADACYNRANALKDEGKIADAMAAYEQTLRLRPHHAEAYNNLGVLLRDQGKLTEALEHFRKASAIHPDHAESRVNEAMLLLLMGDMEAGWRRYEWRWRMKGAKPPRTDKPLWDGQVLAGRTILLEGEQGLGDCIQFVRYASLIKQLGGRIVLRCPSSLARLFTSVDGVVAVVPEGEPLPPYDCHAPLMSLPLLMGTNLATVPNAVPYLYPSQQAVAFWGNRLGRTQELKVGIVWAGNARHSNPTANAVDRRRSINLAALAPLTRMANVRFFSLQKGPAAEQIADLPALAMTNYMDEMTDFADTAALIANLDLVIGVDTSVIHMAGALGKPVWVLSRFDGCWRWLLDRDDSPWYPSLRLFRQSRQDDWSHVIQSIAAALEQQAKKL